MPSFVCHIQIIAKNKGVVDSNRASKGHKQTRLDNNPREASWTSWRSNPL